MHPLGSGGAGGAFARFSWLWLRDHAEDDASLDLMTMQRRVDTFNIDPSCWGSVVGHDDDGTDGFEIRWNDGVTTLHSRRTLYSVAEQHLDTDWSQLQSSNPAIPGDITMWTDSSAMPPKADLQGVVDDDNLLAEGLGQLARYGYLVLRGNSPTRRTAEEFAARLGYVRQTIFGGIWDLAPDLSEHSDTAYSDVFLGCHTDSTYSHDAPGFQFFVCLQPAVEGGESLLVDGFAIAAELAESDPSLYRDLASIPVTGRYIEPGVHLQAERPVLRANPRGVLDQVSFNNYDRAPFLLPGDLEARFYQAYQRFAEMAGDPARRIEVQLSQGDVLIFDNWRTLHGRNSFVGHRHYVGAYLNHEDIESKQRTLTSVVGI